MCPVKAVASNADAVPPSQKETSLTTGASGKEFTVLLISKVSEVTPDAEIVIVLDAEATDVALAFNLT